MKRSRQRLSVLGIAALLGSLVVAAPAGAQTTEKVEKPWMVRLRLLNLEAANKSDAFSALGSSFAKDAVKVADKTFPEVDISYFYTKNLAAELILTYPQRHEVTLQGAGKLGKIDHLPPTLLGQYHFDLPNSAAKPYVGAGFNYTKITRSRLSVAGTDLDVTRSSFGFAYQAGVDVKVGDNLYVNLDYKHLKLATDVKVKASGAKLTKASVDPNLFSIGIGKRF